MEIKELVSFYVNESLQILEVTFRLVNDSDDEIRTGQIELDETYNFGYNFLPNDRINDAFDDDFFENEPMVRDEFEEEVDEDEIIIFLNEYYTIYPKYLPKTELF